MSNSTGPNIIKKFGSTRVGSSLFHKHWAWLQRLASEKRSSVLQTFVNYGRKKFYSYKSYSIRHSKTSIQLLASHFSLLIVCQPNQLQVSRPSQLLGCHPCQLLASHPSQSLLLVTSKSSQLVTRPSPELVTSQSPQLVTIASYQPVTIASYLLVTLASYLLVTLASYQLGHRILLLASHPSQSPQLVTCQLP